MPSNDELIAKLEGLLGKNKDLLHQLLSQLKSRPQTSATYALKRKSQEFQVSGPNIFDYTITGWDELLKFANMKETTVRQYFSKGGGTLQIKLLDDGGSLELYTIKRL